MKLNGHDHSTIQTRLADIITFSPNEKEERNSRTEMAENLGIESLISLNSVGAHLRIKADKVLDTAGLKNVLNRDDLIAGYTYWTLGLSWPEISSLMTERRGTFNIKAETFYGVVNTFSNLLDTTNSQATPLASHKPPAQVAPTLQKSNAAELDYDTEKRRYLHSRFAAYLDKHLPQSERRNARVLAMLGAKVELEGKIYLEAGIPPENIITVERDLEAFKTARENCRRLGGIQCVHGELIDLLREKKPPFDRPFKVVSFDFIGAMCANYIDIVQNTSTCNGAIIRVNLRGAREDAVGSNRIKVAGYMNSDEMHKEIVKHVKAGMSEREVLERGQEFLRGKIEEGGKPFSEARNNYLESLLIENFGLQTKSSSLNRIFKFYDAREETRSSAERIQLIEKKLNNIRAGVPQLAEHLANGVSWSINVSKYGLATGLVLLLEGLPSINNIESYAYKSSGKAGHTFLTSFACIRKSYSDEINASHKTLEPFARILDRCVELSNKSITYNLDISIVNRSRRKEEVIEGLSFKPSSAAVRMSVEAPGNEKLNLKLYIPFRYLLEDMNTILSLITNRKKESRNGRMWL
jgi:hypothetical protein